MALLGQLTLASSPDDVAEAIIKETIRRGYTAGESIACVSTGIQESSLNPRAVSPNGLWKSIYQQDASYPGRDNPNTAISGFLDRLDAKRRSAGAGDIWLNIFWLQQRPGEKTAADAYANGRKAYLTEIKSRIAAATTYFARFGTQGGTSVDTTNRPDFNEYGVWSKNSQSRGDTKVDLFLLHTQDGGGGNDAADNLAQWLAGDVGVSYHYSIGQADDGGVTVCDVVDTDLASWSVLSANNRSINLCFAGSRASWTRQQWIDNAGKAIVVAAYLAVQDALMYGFTPRVIKPPYADDPPGISDHRYVTQHLGDGTHTDVGDGFPWDIFEVAVTHFASGKPQEPADPDPGPEQPADDTPQDAEREVLAQTRGRWEMLGDQTLVEALAQIRDKVCGTADAGKGGFRW